MIFLNLILLSLLTAARFVPVASAASPSGAGGQMNALMRRIRSVRLASGACLGLALASSSPASAADTNKTGREFGEMFWMLVLKGSDMGPTDGWFHPAQSRYGWDWLKARDRNHDGSVSPEELGGPLDLVRRLDRDRDGSIKADDLDWSPQSAYFRQQAAVRKQFVMMDTNTNGKISKAEWDAFFDKSAKHKRGLSLDDLSDALSPPAKEKDSQAKSAASAGPSRWTLLTGLFKGELGSRFEGPNVGDLAPDFTLKTHDGKEEIKLSKFRRKKPVVLIFGSFT
jgi:hypothetical protein